LKRSVIKDFFCEKRIRLGSNEILDSGWRTNWRRGKEFHGVSGFFLEGDDE